MKPVRRGRSNPDLFRECIDAIIDMRHGLVRLAGLMPWLDFDESFGKFFKATGRPAKPTRLMVGLHYLKHVYDLSDEEVVERWVENPYHRVPRSWREFAGATVSEMGDEASRSRPAGAGFKPLHAAAFKRRGGERWRKGGARRRQVSVEKMSASEPLTTHRNGFRRCQNGRGVGNARMSMDDTCLRSLRQPVYRRHDLTTGFDMERGNLAWSAKGNPQAAPTARENTNIHDRGGAARSSAEAAVMAVERRGCVILPDNRRQPTCPGGAS